MICPPRSVRSFICGALTLWSAAVAAAPAGAQSARLPAHRVAAAPDEPCAGAWLGISDATQAGMRLEQHPADRRRIDFEPLCATANFLTDLTGQGSAPPRFDAAAGSQITEDPIETELAAMGSDGMRIAGARQQVLEILREGNSCSAWFAAEQSDPAVKFASLHFQSDLAGSSFSLGAFDSRGFSVIQPYVARTRQDVGAGSTITLNAHGAFFRQRALTHFRAPGGAPDSRPAISMLHVGEYQGGSLKAQVATLLHEYAHVIGLIPVDTGRPDAAQLSTQNTETVLRHCRKQIDASPNRTILLPASFANF